jgi:hypothetical protein
LKISKVSILFCINKINNYLISPRLNKMPNKWMTHVKKTMKKMSGQKKSMGKGWFKTVLKAAKSSYHKKGGADPEPAAESTEDDASKASDSSLAAAMGGRRRRTRKHRRRHH